MFTELLNRMNPKTCLTPCALSSVSVDEDEPDGLEAAVPHIIHDVTSPDVGKETRTSALRRLYRLTDLRHKENRVPLVCTSKWDVITSLSSCLAASTAETDADEDRRLACLALNNLSIPLENKAVMAFGEASDTLLISLAHVIRMGLPQCYLCIMCLMNVSFLEDAVERILYFSTTLAVEGGADGFQQRRRDPLDDPNSLLRIIEKKMQTYSPYLSRKVLSVEGESVRWSVGLLRNFSATEEHATLVSRTDMPRLIVSYINRSRLPVVKWTKDSLEEMALQVLCNLARWPKSKEVLKAVGAAEAVEPILGAGGIHDFRAGMIKCSLEGQV